jgi:hypothetical protein
MSAAPPFAEVLDAADRLSPEEQETLIVILRRRLAEQGRKRLAAEVREARQEFAEGRCQPAGADDLMREILS